MTQDRTGREARFGPVFLLQKFSKKYCADKKQTEIRGRKNGIEVLIVYGITAKNSGKVLKKTHITAWNL